MDKISESIFSELPNPETVAENPSLLTVVFEITSKSWFAIRNEITIHELVKSLLVFLNAHLALNNSNQVAFITSSPSGSKFLHPNPQRNYDENDLDSAATKSFVNAGMYRQFRMVDEAVISELNEELGRLASAGKDSDVSTLSGALSMALTYTNRMLHFDQSISTTTASAINSTTSAVNNSGATEATVQSGNISPTSMDSRILIVTANDTYDSNYIAIMNSIFAAQKMKVPIDVAKLGSMESPYLQQAADATNGVYMHITEPHGLIQVLSTAYFVEPCLRSTIILPTNSNVDYKASCFLSGKPVDVGYVCSVCLCIMSLIPTDGHCPTCKSKFNEKLLEKLRTGPAIVRKKRKVENGTNGS